MSAIFCRGQNRVKQGSMGSNLKNTPILTKCAPNDSSCQTESKNIVWPIFDLSLGHYDQKSGKVNAILVK